MCNENTRLKFNALPANEQKAINLRRKLLRPEDQSDTAAPHGDEPELKPCAGIYGLALSGGGIRSATFSLGLLRALAKNELLHKFDYLSTVSGGGYTGGMLGRCYQEGSGPLAVEAGLGKDNSLLLGWLRNNGRYLTPAGTRDIALSFGQILRSFFASLFFVTLLCIICAGLALQLQLLLPPDLKHFPLLVAIPAALAAWLAISYWYFRQHQDWLLLGLGISILLCLVFLFWSPVPWGLSLLIWLICMAPWVHIFRQIKDLAAFRLALTQALTWDLLIITLLAALWGLNRAGFLLWFSIFHGPNTSIMLISSPLSIAAVRLLKETQLINWLLSRISAGNKRISFNLMLAGNIAGYLLMLFCLTTVCAALIEISTVLNVPLAGFKYLPLMTALTALLILWLLGKQPRFIEFLNLSSLHNLYRARIERAWVSTGNYPHKQNKATKPRFPQNPLDDKLPGAMDAIEKITTTVAGDDVAMENYAPHNYGGPIHLITSCINQTIDDRSDNYNADRKGIALTVSSFGVETGTQFPESPENLNDTTLSQWLAISGAAVSTGMGSKTSPGLAFMIYLVGGRLGFWSKNLSPSRQAKRKKSAPGLQWPHTHLTYLFAEMFARFPGLSNEKWYLTDGGHFENTAVYPLLKRRLDSIVVADCGADPHFLFDDLENLVRKAKIDMAIDIVFKTPINSDYTSQSALKVKQPSPALLQAIVHYPEINGFAKKTGQLLIIKPHLLPGMDLATASYAGRNDTFPQQTTGDQFFDEAQWEAYHQLGFLAGSVISEQHLFVIKKAQLCCALSRKKNYFCLRP